MTSDTGIQSFINRVPDAVSFFADQRPESLLEGGRSAA